MADALLPVSRVIVACRRTLKDIEERRQIRFSRRVQEEFVSYRFRWLPPLTHDQAARRVKHAHGSGYAFGDLFTLGKCVKIVALAEAVPFPSVASDHLIVITDEDFAAFGRFYSASENIDG